MQKAISVITICRNEARRIRKTAESVASQDFPDFEWIVIDGVSTDGTLEILSGFRARIADLRSNHDNGVYGAQNHGARLATSERLIFLNGGDYFASPGALTALLKSACDADADIAYGDLIAIDPEGEERLLHAPDRIDLEHMMRDTIWHPTALIRAELFAQHGPYDESFRIASDYDFFLKAVSHGRAKTVRCAQPIAYFHADGLGSRPEFAGQQRDERRRSQAQVLSPMVVEFWEREFAAARDSSELATRLAKSLGRRALLAAPPSAQESAEKLVSFIQSQVGRRMRAP